MIILSKIPITSAIDILLDYLGFPDPPDDYTRGEILADIVATGLMHGGPFDSYNVFQHEILPDHYVSWCNFTQALMKTLHDECKTKKLTNC